MRAGDVRVGDVYETRDDEEYESAVFLVVAVARDPHGPLEVVEIRYVFLDGFQAGQEFAYEAPSGRAWDDEKIARLAP